jgi:hypothetical protein
MSAMPLKAARKQTSAGSESCQTRTHALQQSSPVFAVTLGGNLQNGDAKFISRFDVDHQLEIVGCRTADRSA